MVKRGASVLGSAGPWVGIRQGIPAKVPTSCVLGVLDEDQVGQGGSLVASLPCPTWHLGGWSLGEEACLGGGD